jgi:hypothetical protein
MYGDKPSRGRGNLKVELNRRLETSDLCQSYIQRYVIREKTSKESLCDLLYRKNPLGF